MAGSGHRPGQFDTVGAVDLLQVHGDVVAEGRWNVLSDVVGPDRQLPMAAVDQHGQLDDRGPAVVPQRVQRGADGAPGVQDVVDQDHDGIIDTADRDAGLLQRARRVQPQIVPVQGDVQRSDGRRPTGEGGQPVAEPAGQVNAPGRDAQQHDRVVAVALQDLMGDPIDGPADVGPAENFGQNLGVARIETGAFARSRQLSTGARPWIPA